MDRSQKKEFDLYKDIQNRTNGEIYLGIVGPVRTGKSTFIKRFMDLMVLPYMENAHDKERTIDELPQAHVYQAFYGSDGASVYGECAR